MAAVGIAEGDVDAGKFFVLKKNADHFGTSEVGAESEFDDAIAIFIGVALVPEFVFEIFAFARDMLQAGACDFEDQGRALQVAVLAIEVVAGGSVTDEGAVDGGWRGENFTGRKTGTLQPNYQAPRLHPIQRPITIH